MLVSNLQTDDEATLGWRDLVKDDPVWRTSWQIVPPISS
jgi:hypothetical protein